MLMPIVLPTHRVAAGPVDEAVGVTRAVALLHQLAAPLVVDEGDAQRPAAPLLQATRRAVAHVQPHQRRYRRHLRYRTCRHKYKHMY